jgi:hypothetical protein
MDYDMDFEILTTELRGKMNNFPTVDCFDEEETRCDACRGDGTVEYEFYHNHKCYEIEEDCPVCEGEGKIIKTMKTPNGKKEFDYTQQFKIGVCFFNPERIQELLFVAEKLGAEKIRLVNQSQPDHACLFVVNEVEVILMPCSKSYDNEIGGIINI